MLRMPRRLTVRTWRNSSGLTYARGISHDAGADHKAAQRNALVEGKLFKARRMTTSLR